MGQLVELLRTTEHVVSEAGERRALEGLGAAVGDHVVGVDLDEGDLASLREGVQESITDG